MLKGIRKKTIPAAIFANLQPLIFDLVDTSTPKEGDRIQLFEAVVSLLMDRFFAIQLLYSSTTFSVSSNRQCRFCIT